MNKLIEYKYSNYPIIRCFKYGSSSKVDLVVLCQHGYNSESFLKHFSHLLRSFDSYPSDIISRYLDIECDFGARSLAISLSKILSESFNTLFIGVDCDRGIMDANRLSEYCVSPFIQNTYSDSVIFELKEMNVFIREKIFSIFKEYLTPSSFIVDVHSMWPYNMNIPDDKLNNIEEFTKSHLNMNFLGSRRNINLIVHEEDGSPISDAKLAYFIEKELINNKYSVEYDNPFYMLPIRSNYQYFKYFSGIALDIPRNLLGKSKSEDSNDFTFMHEDEEMINDICRTIASGFIKIKTNQR